MARCLSRSNATHQCTWQLYRQFPRSNSTGSISSKNPFVSIYTNNNYNPFPRQAIPFPAQQSPPNNISLLTLLYSSQNNIIQMPNDKMNKVLRDRKLKNKQVASYRKQRIMKNYQKLEKNNAEELQNQSAEKDEGTRRRLEFYQQVFKEQKPVKQQPKDRTPTPQQQVDNQEGRMQKLKSKKKKFIRKMQMQKTNRGQPVMRNYVKYALAKLQQTLEKEKNDKKRH